MASTADSSPSITATAAMLQAQYRARSKIADALYGTVWLCEDLRHMPQSPTGADMVVVAHKKTAPPLVAVKQVSLRRARLTLQESPCMDNPWDERRIAAKISQLGGHGNVLRFRHDFVESGSWFIVTDYCDGGDLLEQLQQAPDARFDEAMTLPLFAQIARGVRFLHANGIAHRDLSLENVLLRDGVCKLSDFGLCTDTTRVCTERVGKAYYMAPEVVAGQSYDPAAADMWSLGIMLFILLTGSPLTPGADVNDQNFQALETYGVHKIVATWGLEAEISAAAIDLLTGLLEVNVAKRFTIDDLLAQPVLQALP